MNIKIIMNNKFWIFLCIAIIVVVVVIIVFYRYYITQDDYSAGHSCIPSLTNPQCSSGLWCSNGTCTPNLAIGASCVSTLAENGCQYGCDSITSECFSETISLNDNNTQQANQNCAVNGNNCASGLYCTVTNLQTPANAPLMVVSTNGYSTTTPPTQAPLCSPFDIPGSICKTLSDTTESNCEYGCEPISNLCMSAPVSVTADNSGGRESYCAINGENCGSELYCTVEQRNTPAPFMVTSSNGYQTIVSQNYVSICEVNTVPGGTCIAPSNTSEESCEYGCDSGTNTCFNPQITVSPNNSQALDSACIPGNNNCEAGLYCTMTELQVDGPVGPTTIISTDGKTSLYVPKGYLTTCQTYDPPNTPCVTVSSTSESNCQYSCDTSGVCLGETVDVNTTNGTTGAVCVPNGQNCDSSYYCSLIDNSGLAYPSMYESSNNNQSIIVPGLHIYNCVPKLQGGDLCTSDDQCPDQCYNFGNDIGQRCTQYDITVQENTQSLYYPCAIGGNNCTSDLYCASVNTGVSMNYDVVSANNTETHNNVGYSSICMNPLPSNSACDDTSPETNQCSNGICANNICQEYTTINLNSNGSGALYDQCVVNGDVCSSDFYCTIISSNDTTWRKVVASNNAYAFLNPGQTMACEQKILDGDACVSASATSEEPCSTGTCTNLVCVNESA